MIKPKLGDIIEFIDKEYEEFINLSNELKYIKVSEQKFKIFKEDEFTNEDNEKLTSMQKQSGFQLSKMSKSTKLNANSKDNQNEIVPAYFIVHSTEDLLDVKNEMSISRMVSKFLVDCKASAYPHNELIPFEIILHHESRDYSDVSFLSGKFKLFPSRSKSTNYNRKSSFDPYKS